MRIEPFRIDVSENDLQILHAKLQAARLPTSLDPDEWADGAGLDFMRRLLDYWRSGYDWRKNEARLNRLPQFKASVGDQDIHFIHRRGVGENAIPIVLTHGWPGSFIEMEQLIDMLADPVSHGASSQDVFDVIVPSLPGYGFSSAPARKGIGAREIAILWRDLMNGLGYTRFAAQGGDIGAGVSIWLARLFPAEVRGIHLNYIPATFRPFVTSDLPVTEAEKAFLDRAVAWAADEGAYAAMQGTKPQTLAFSLNDSPLGLAAWMTEKFRSWSDCGGDVETVIPMDELLTNISLYWFFSDMTSTLRLYKENRARPHVFEEGEHVAVPLGMAVFPKELPVPPRSWVERAFDVRQWNAMPSGGHFAALEQPQLLASEIRTFFRPMRDT